MTARDFERDPRSVQEPQELVLAEPVGRAEHHDVVLAASVVVLKCVHAPAGNRLGISTTSGDEAKMSFGPWPDVVLRDRRADERDQDQDDDGDRACDRDLVAPEAAPDELPVAASANVLALAELSARLVATAAPRPAAPETTTVFFAVDIEVAEVSDAARAKEFVDLARCVQAVSASAPATTSRISWVISAWRARFIWSVRLSISSPAFFDALRIAVMRAPCSEAADSSSAR